MSLFTTFNQSDRTQNGGKYTGSPLLVRFELDEGSYTYGSDTYRTATRYVEKSYEWRGYDLQTAKAVAEFYANGNSSRQGYYRRHPKLTYNGSTAAFDVDWIWKNFTTVTVNHDGGRMYTVNLNVAEADPFFFNAALTPTSFDGWAGLFASWVHDRVAYAGGEAWAAVNLGTTTPYTYETYYDEPLTTVT